MGPFLPNIYQGRIVASVAQGRQMLLTFLKERKKIVIPDLTPKGYKYLAKSELELQF